LYFLGKNIICFLINMDYQVIIIGIYSVYNPFYLIKIIMYHEQIRDPHRDNT